MKATMVPALDCTAWPVRTLPSSWRMLMGSWLTKTHVPGPVVEDVQLAASELITNACQHAPAGTKVRLRIRAGAGWVGLGVWDASPQVPKAKPDPLVALADGDNLDAVLAVLSADDVEHGRGLAIVNQVARDFTVVRTTPGKWVRVLVTF
ncbi:hypothetical protein Acsp03_56640 [Actinomadura sp. NBRC 104412]|uniref:ATP-binding protein n=1 Tax=Actinomadura sp. NBRC 104412 TaxID=3032203 RepID=UPI0024A3E1F3|nr:ATP-binding protein [Actinomadura sp. NBRC 104412]GLZ08198.1 hypothetical protein Acsp03_56640 [Actinomadura sp. NBRC 104412]